MATVVAHAPALPTELRISGVEVWTIGRKLGSGSFGAIHLGTNQIGKEVAVKFELRACRHPQLIFESRVLKYLAQPTAVGVPNMEWFYQEGTWSALGMETLGPSLEEMFQQCGHRFSVKTTLMLADQLLRRVEYVHSHYFIHRDVKPDNFLLGTAAHESTIYIIDFGLAKRYRDKDMKHIDSRGLKPLTGTARYASINSHLGLEQSRRDDLESIGYCLMYFLRGSLPWQGLKVVKKEYKYYKIGERKISWSPETLGKGFPAEFATYLLYVRALTFDQDPNYGYCRKLFRDLFLRLGYEYDSVYDWTERRAPPLRPTSATADATAAASAPMITTPAVITSLPASASASASSPAPAAVSSPLVVGSSVVAVLQSSMASNAPNTPGVLMSSGKDAF